MARSSHGTQNWPPRTWCSLRHEVFMQDTYHSQGSRKYPTSQKIISPQHQEEGQVGSVCKKLVPCSETMFAIIFFLISVQLFRLLASVFHQDMHWGITAAQGQQHLGRMRRMLSCVWEDVESSVIFNVGSHGEMITSSEREKAARCSCNAGQRLLGFYQHA